MTLPLVVTDDLLYSGEEPNAINVLAATLGHPDRNPSLTELAKATGLNRHTVVAAQKQLSDWKWITEEKIGIPLVVYDRPEHFYDRASKTDPRFNRTNKLTHVVRPEFDPDKAQNYIKLPGEVNAKLPKSRSSSAIRLIALHYAREQLRRGAIQVTDEVVAADLGLSVIRNGVWEEPNVRQVKATRTKLVEKGILVVYDADARPCPIYTMPGATPQKPERPELLNQNRTKQLFEAEKDGEALCVHATPDQWQHILDLVRRLGEKPAIDALFAAKVDPLLEHEAEDVIRVLADTLRAARRDTYPDTTRYLVQHDETLISARRDTGKALTSTSDQTPSRPPDESEADQPPSTAQDGEMPAGKGVRPSRREWPSSHSKVFYFADDATHQQIEKIIASIERKHGLDEAKAVLRRWTFEERETDGRVVLLDLEDRWGYLVPIAPEVTDLLDDLGSAFKRLPE